MKLMKWWLKYLLPTLNSIFFEFESNMKMFRPNLSLNVNFFNICQSNSKNFEWYSDLSLNHTFSSLIQSYGNYGRFGSKMILREFWEKIINRSSLSIISKHLTVIFKYEFYKNLERSLTVFFGLIALSTNILFYIQRQL